MSIATPFVIIGVVYAAVAIMGTLDHFSTADRTIDEEPGGEYTRTPLKHVIGLAACAVASFAIAALIQWMTP